MLTKEEVAKLLSDALAIQAAREPRPATVTIGEAAAMLDVSERTIRRMRPPRAAGARIPYAWVRERLASK